MEITILLILIISFFGLLALGVPVAYSLGISTALTLAAAVLPLSAVTTVAQRIATGIDSFTLLAIPFFVLAGELMNQGGIAKRLVDFAKALLGSLPGGLAYVNVLAAMLFGAISGSSVAAASAIGGIMIDRMEEEGYERDYSAAVNLAASTTGLIIPPSNILIVYSLASGGASIAALFLAGYIPGIIVGLSLIGVAAFVAFKRNYPREALASIGEIFRQLITAIPSLLLLVIIIGGIVGGIFTATEAAAIAVLYALILALIYGEIGLKNIPGILLNASRTTSIVMFVIGASIAMSWVLAFLEIPQNMTQFLLGLSQNKVVILLLINLILLVVGTFMDITPAVLIFTPIFLPVVVELGMDPVHFGIIMVLNLCIGLCTPPVGTILFVGSSVAKVPVTQVIKPLIPLLIAMIVALFLITYIPQLSLWLPGIFGF
ncbi:MAG: TRAP transporter large permease subunit [Bacteroidota bacterium]